MAKKDKSWGGYAQGMVAHTLIMNGGADGRFTSQSQNRSHETACLHLRTKGFGHSHSAKRGKVSFKASYEQQTRNALETAST
jgi:hypothetical protein